jgi:hypothetical protein
MNLPTDIIYSAIDSVGDDVSTLKSLSLTSKSLTDYSQRRLLRHPSYVVQLDCAPREGLGNFWRLLNTKPLLATAVKSFSLAFCRRKNDSHRLDIPPSEYIEDIQTFMDKYASQILVKLTQLESVKRESHDYWEIVRPCYTTSLHWMQHLSSLNLTSLTIAHLPITIPSSLRARAPQLRSITSDCAPLRISHETKDQEDMKVTVAPRPIYLRNFQLTLGPRESRVYEDQPDPNQLLSHPGKNTLSFRDLQSFTFGALSHVHHGMASNIMAIASYTLSHLNLQMPERSAAGGFTCEHRDISFAIFLLRQGWG